MTARLFRISLVDSEAIQDKYSWQQGNSGLTEQLQFNYLQKIPRILSPFIVDKQIYRKYESEEFTRRRNYLTVVYYIFAGVMELLPVVYYILLE